MGVSCESAGIEALKVALRRLGWSGNRLAAELGTTSGVVSRWLTGKRAPDRDYALKIQRVTGVDVSAWGEPANVAGQSHAQSMTRRKRHARGGRVYSARKSRARA